MSTSYFPGIRFLHAPGPTHIPKAVMDAVSCQPLDMAEPRLSEVIHSCEQGLKRVMGTQDSDVFLYAANGHGAWEAVIVNVAAPGQKVLIPGTGHFSDSWAQMTEAMGVQVVRTPFREGFPVDPAEVEAVLNQDKAHEIVAVFAIQTDTASSTTNDIPALRRALDAAKHPALFVVDVVASLGACPYQMDAWGVNVTMGASQKGLMTPPGIGLCAVDKKAMAVSKANPSHRFYWDWVRRQDAPAYKKFCGTAPQNLLMGLEVALGLLFKEGLDQVHARHRLLASAVQAAVMSWSKGGKLRFLCSVPDARSVSVTSVHVEQGIDPEQIRTVARERFQVAMAGGLGPFSGRVFRIGHLGDMNAAMILGALSGIEAALRHLGIPIEDGVTKAVEVLSRG